jgi:hypothetical protein
VLIVFMMARSPARASARATSVKLDPPDAKRQIASARSGRFVAAEE